MPLKNRKSLRYKPSKLEFALVMFDGQRSIFDPDDAALIIDVSAVAGVQLVLKTSEQCNINDQIRVKMGNLDPIRGVIVWRRDIDLDLIRVGVRFTE